MDIKYDSSEGTEKKKKEESWKESHCLPREYVNNHNQNVGKIWTLKAI